MVMGFETMFVWLVDRHLGRVWIRKRREPHRKPEVSEENHPRLADLDYVENAILVPPALLEGTLREA
jgi:hypothetical protein